MCVCVFIDVTIIYEEQCATKMDFVFDKRRFFASKKGWFILCFQNPFLNNNEIMSGNL